MSSDAEKTIRKVKVLQGRAKAEAEKMGLSPEDLVIVTTTVREDSPQEYCLEKVEGDPVSFLLKLAKKGSEKVGGLEAQAPFCEKVASKTTEDIVLDNIEDISQKDNIGWQWKKTHPDELNTQWIRLAEHQQQIQKAVDDALEEFIFEITEYGLEKDENLTEGAQNLKQKTLDKIPKLKEIEGQLERIREHIKNEPTVTKGYVSDLELYYEQCHSIFEELRKEAQS